VPDEELDEVMLWGDVSQPCLKDKVISSNITPKLAEVLYRPMKRTYLGKSPVRAQVGPLNPVRRTKKSRSKNPSHIVTSVAKNIDS